jgi:hypothetical protein
MQTAPQQLPLIRFSHCSLLDYTTKTRTTYEIVFLIRWRLRGLVLAMDTQSRTNHAHTKSFRLHYSFVIIVMVGFLEAIIYKRGHLQLLNQLLIPGQSVFVDVNSAADGWNAIRMMKVRGAPAIAIAAALSLAVELHARRSEVIPPWLVEPGR